MENLATVIGVIAVLISLLKVRHGGRS